jgi:hypothetical protein
MLIYISTNHDIYLIHYLLNDRLCGLVVRVLGYRSGGPGSIPGTTRKKKLGLELVHSASRGQLRSYLIEK